MNKKLNIFNSAFGIRANLKIKELEVQKFWTEINLLSLVKKRKGSTFTIHFGPPYANGSIHIGHALNFILKDIAIRFETMQGKEVLGLPGWDTHGLPIAIAVGKNNPQIINQKLLFRQVCAQFAKEQIIKQIQQLKRLGLEIDFSNYYQTLTKDYVSKELKIFGQLVDKGLIFTSQKPVFWSWSSQTALAETEVEYLSKKTRTVFFYCETDMNDLLPDGTVFLLWTTTAWTIPENKLIAVNAEENYLLIEIDKVTKKMVVGERALQKLKKQLNWTAVKIINLYSGKQLVGINYYHPYLKKRGLVVSGAHVDWNEGTGLVHLAPAFGKDDYQLAKKWQVNFHCAVDEKGYFNEHSADQDLKGIFYQKSEDIIIARLNGKKTLVQTGELVHQYPHDWITRKPVIYRTTQQWYLNLKPLKKNIVEIINKVDWTPSWAKKRMMLTLSQRVDWCLSRQRSWGTPIPIFIDQKNNYVIETKLINQVANLVAQNGDDIWWKWTIEQLLTKEQINKYQIVDRLQDTFDVWFDSGCSATIIENQKPIDIIWEGNDQFRGWFNSLIIVSAALKSSFPIKSIVTHGFVNDEKGNKMSKSLGNVVDPNEICQNLGADILRLWTVSGNYFEDINISKQIVNNVAINYTKIRNTIRFLINNLVDFEEKDSLQDEIDNNLDRWILIKLEALLKKSKQCFQTHSYHSLYLSIINFVTIDLSQLYFDYAKNILYVVHPQAKRRRQIQTTLFIITKKLLSILAPVLAHTTEEAYQMLNFSGQQKSVHLEQWPLTNVVEINSEQKWIIALETKLLCSLKNDVDKSVEKAIKEKVINRPEEAEVYFDYNTNYQLFKNEKDYKNFLQTVQLKSSSRWQEIAKKWNNTTLNRWNKDNLRFLFRIHQLHWSKNEGTKCSTGVVLVKKTTQQLCTRCWFNSKDKQKEHCSQCIKVMQQQSFTSVNKH